MRKDSREMQPWEDLRAAVINMLPRESQTLSKKKKQAEELHLPVTPKQGETDYFSSFNLSDF